jgi:methylglutaconyl-CoA hydratase
MSMITSQTLGPVGHVTLSRPAKRNALTRTMIHDLTQQVDEFGARADITVIVLDAEGPDFCSGLDLEELLESTDPSRPDPEDPAAHWRKVRKFEEALPLAHLIRRIHEAPQPVIAAVQGRAWAGGLALVLAADLAIAAPDASFGAPEVRIGFVPAIVGTLLHRRIPAGAANEMLLFGDSMDAERAASLGIVTRVLGGQDPDLPSATRAYADALAQRPSHALRATKRTLAQTKDMSLEPALLAATEANAAARGPELRATLSRMLGRV